MDLGLYILDGITPVKCFDTLTWGRWLQDNERHVADSSIGAVRVSTVFLGIVSVWGDPRGAPILFETMVFGGEFNHHTERYRTWVQAENGHKKIVNMVSEDALLNQKVN